MEQSEQKQTSKLSLIIPNDAKKEQNSSGKNLNETEFGKSNNSSNGGLFDENLPIPDEKPKFEGYKTNSLLYHFLCVFGVIFLSIFFLFQVYLSPITVVGQSMLPNINKSTTSVNDQTHCDVVYYRQKSSYTYGDIIIISNQQSQYINSSQKVEFLIKRIVACPGDTITFYLTYVNEDSTKYYYDISVTKPNGTAVELNEEKYIKEPMYLAKPENIDYTYTGFYKKFAPVLLDDSITDLSMRKVSVTISENCYFAMGDNRNDSSDSRYFGEINYNDICGNVRLQVEYGENIWIALFKKIKSYLSVSITSLRKIVWEKNY